MHSELAKGTLSDILKQCGLKLEEFLALHCTVPAQAENAETARSV